MSGFEIDAATWGVLNRLLDEALDQPEAQREAWIDALALEYAPLKPRLRSLLSRAASLSASDSALGTLPKFLPPEASDPHAETGELPTPEPDLRPGDSLGPYEIRGLLGVGGMGRVYRAFDPSLAREVAIKGLTQAQKDDPASLLRVEREARVLANLNHPNIAGIHGLERIAGAPYLILELVEGETLAERLQRGALPAVEVVAVAVQLASALEEAHRKGVVHRDLKPSNLKLGADGRLKVLDFGIAMRVPGASGLPQDAVPATATGLVRGTAPYMAPEQVRGERADARSDIWAFGCLLFEMLTGERSFAGASAAEIMASVLRDEVDWSRLPAETPAPLRRLARRCLAREKADRLQDIGDARVELQALERGESEETSPPRPKPETAFWRRALPWGLGAALFAALAASLVPRPPGHPAAPVAAARLGLGLPPGLALEADYAAPFTITPDGRRIALLARREGPPLLYLREMDGVELRAVAGTEEAWQPFFSPDGQELAFFADRKLKRVPLSGGAPRTVAEVGDNPRGGAFGEDGAIILAPSYNTGLSRMLPSGGGAVPLTELDLRRGESSHRWPQVLPGGEWAVFTVGYEGESYDDAAVEAVSLARGERRRLVTGGAFGRYVAGQLLYAQAGRLLAVPMDLSPPALRGEPQVALENIRYDPRNGSTHLAVARVEALLYQGGVPASFEHHLAFVDVEGRLSRFEGPARRFREPRLSPDGRRVAVVIGPAAGSDLWVADVGASTLTRVTFGLSPRRPVWTPDGSGVTVGVAVGDRFQLQTLGIAGGGPPAVLYESAQWVFPSDWSADGRRLVFQERRAETGWDLRVLDFPEPGGSGVVRDLAAGPHQETNATVSPDGRMFAYESDELDGVVEVYVRPLEAPGAHVRVTRLGANWPRFGRGGELYYWVAPRVHPGGQRLAEGLHRLDLRWSGGAITPGPASPVWPVGVRGPALFDRLQVAAFAAYDVEPTRPVRRFLALESLPAEGAPPSAGPVVVLGGLGVPRVVPSRGDAPRP